MFLGDWVKGLTSLLCLGGHGGGGKAGRGAGRPAAFMMEGGASSTLQCSALRQTIIQIAVLNINNKNLLFYAFFFKLVGTVFFQIDNPHRHLLPFLAI